MRFLFPLLFLLAWAPSLGGGFHFDDHSLLFDAAIQSGDVWGLLQTRPLTQFTFWLSSGSGTPSYHLWNFLLHACNTMLAWLVLRSLGMPAATRWIALAIFALHPIQSEPVNYVFARSTLLMSAFCLAALWCWIEERPWIATALFALALLAKEECVTLPLLLVLIDRWRGRDRIRWIPAGTMLAMAFAAGLRAIAATAATPGAGAGFASPISPLAYLKAQGFVIAMRYWRMLIVPWGFTVDPEVADPGWVLAIAFWAGIGSLALLAWRRLRPAGFWFLAGLLLLVPSSSIFPAEDLAADRRMYLPLLAFGAFAAAAVLHRTPRWLIMAGAIALAVVSYDRSANVWRTEKTLWSEACERSPGKTRPRLQLSRVSKIEDAKRLLEEAARLEPRNSEIPNELGLLLLRGDNPAEAFGAFGKALALAPGDAKAMNNRGAALFQLGQADAARQDFERALQLDPCLADARRNLVQMGAQAPPDVCSKPH